MKFFNLLLVAFLLLSCHSKLTNKKNTIKPGYLNVPLKDLLKNKGNYHNKLIQTEGYCFCGVDHISIQTEMTLLSDTGDRLKSWSQSIWVTMQNAEYTFPCETMNNKIVVITGFFDTSKHGFLGVYAAD